MRRIEHRHAEMDQRVIALMRHGGGTRRMVITAQHQNAAVLRCTSKAAMLERITRTVHPRPLAVPQ